MITIDVSSLSKDVPAWSGQGEGPVLVTWTVGRIYSIHDATLCFEFLVRTSNCHLTTGRVYASHYLALDPPKFRAHREGPFSRSFRSATGSPVQSCQERRASDCFTMSPQLVVSCNISALVRSQTERRDEDCSHKLGDIRGR